MLDSQTVLTDVAILQAEISFEPDHYNAITLLNDDQLALFGNSYYTLVDISNKTVLDINGPPISCPPESSNFEFLAISPNGQQFVYYTDPNLYIADFSRPLAATKIELHIPKRNVSQLPASDIFFSRWVDLDSFVQKTYSILRPRPAALSKSCPFTI